MRITPDQIVDTITLAVIATDTDGHIAFANRRAGMLLNLPDVNAYCPVHISQVLPLVEPLLVKCLKTRQPQVSREKFGDDNRLLIHVSPVVSNDTMEGFVCVFDTLMNSESCETDLELYRNLNRELDAVFHSSSDGIWVCDGEGRIINCNEASEKLNGIRLDDYRGAYVRELVRKEMLDQSVTTKVLGTRGKASIVQYVKKTRKHLLVTGTPVFDENGHISMVVVNERDMTELNATKQQLEQSRMETEKYRQELAELSMLELKEHEIIAESDEMKQVLRVALKLARLEASNILILGESGTGKGLLTKFIHQNSSRNTRPLIQINCAALPENLLEAELFGYEKGAFTGASEQGKAGLFELAHEGVLFLDEIGDLPMTVQAKLLKYLDDHEIMHLGGVKPRKVNCMIIAATNRDLEMLSRQKKFRQDLFYRLNAFTIRIPPLRERTDYMYELVHHFLEKYNNQYSCNKKISRKGMAALQSFNFPGNVRELKNLLKKSVVMTETDSLDDFIVKSISEKTDKKEIAGNLRKNSLSLNDELMIREREVLKKARSLSSSTREMARLIGISQPSVVRKMKQHGLDPVFTKK